MLVGARFDMKPRYDGKLRSVGNHRKSLKLKSCKNVREQFCRIWDIEISILEPMLTKINRFFENKFPYIFLYFPIRPVWGLSPVSWFSESHPSLCGHSNMSLNRLGGAVHNDIPCRLPSLRQLGGALNVLLRIPVTTILT